MTSQKSVESVKKSRALCAIDARIPTEREILENPRRRRFLGGGWVDSSDLSIINVYWHRRQRLFTVYSLLSVLEHETLHSVLGRLLGLEISMKLDKVHRSSCAWISQDKLIFVNQFWFRKWTYPSYVEEPQDSTLE